MGEVMDSEIWDDAAHYRAERAQNQPAERGKGAVAGSCGESQPQNARLVGGGAQVRLRGCRGIDLAAAR